MNHLPDVGKSRVGAGQGWKYWRSYDYLMQYSVETSPTFWASHLSDVRNSWAIADHGWKYCQLYDYLVQHDVETSPTFWANHLSNVGNSWDSADHGWQYHQSYDLLVQNGVTHHFSCVQALCMCRIWHKSMGWLCRVLAPESGSLYQCFVIPIGHVARFTLCSGYRS